VASLPPFHIAVQVRNIAETRAFYTKVLGCIEGRYAETWVDFNFFGHQFVCHLNSNIGANGKIRSFHNSVDNHDVPIPHCGIILAMDDWKKLAEKLQNEDVDFVIEPYIRFKGLAGEQATMFLMDPSGNALEFKGFTDIDAQLFSTTV